MAVLVFALIAGLITWLITATSDDSSKSKKATTTIVSEQGLQKLVGAFGEPAFLVGPEPVARYSV